MKRRKRGKTPIRRGVQTVEQLEDVGISRDVLLRRGIWRQVIRMDLFEDEAANQLLEMITGRLSRGSALAQPASELRCSGHSASMATESALDLDSLDTSYLTQQYSVTDRPGRARYPQVRLLNTCARMLKQ